MNSYYKDFETFILENNTSVYRMWQYKKSWTPWEEKNCTSFDTNLVNEECEFIAIRECITLPDGDILIGAQHICSNDADEVNNSPDTVSVYYYKLSEISLARVPCDQFNYQEG